MFADIWDFFFRFYFPHLKRFFHEAAARMPRKWENTKDKEEKFLKFRTLDISSWELVSFIQTNSYFLVSII